MIRELFAVACLLKSWEISPGALQDLSLLEVMIERHRTGCGLRPEQFEPTFDPVEEAELLLWTIENETPYRRTALRRQLKKNPAGLYADWLDGTGLFKERKVA